MEADLHRLIFKAVDNQLSDAEFLRLQDALESNPELRESYLRAIAIQESLTERACSDEELGEAVSDSADSLLTHQLENDRATQALRKVLARKAIAAASIAAALFGLMTFWIGTQVSQTDSTTAVMDASQADPETRLSGHATLRKMVDVQLRSGESRLVEGDVLSNGILSFESGIIEVDFFCGATVLIEGPARFGILSDWELEVTQGRFRANVPPAARGFTVMAGDTEIIDLGTEFVLEVTPDTAHVEVVDGEIEIRRGETQERLVTGQEQRLKGEDLPESPLATQLRTLPSLERQHKASKVDRFAEWQAASSQRRQDNRLIAYYPVSGSMVAESPAHPASFVASPLAERIVRNAAPTGRDRDGLLLGPVDVRGGRFGPGSLGLDFERPGARLRTRIDGEFKAFTFTCWARIDSLEHRFNALFMADSYENGEPHWQIRDDGRLMFSVMVDDTQKIEYFSSVDKRLVRDAGLHKVYLTKPFWDLTKSGQWFHLVATYDPMRRVVHQYVNGKQIAKEKIEDKYLVPTLRIGAAEIGNWGQPFRKTPLFAVRNLNGTIDELAIYETALDEQEVKELYQAGKPVGY